jgi:hypothetical protein
VDDEARQTLACFLKAAQALTDTQNPRERYAAITGGEVGCRRRRRLVGAIHSARRR